MSKQEVSYVQSQSSGWEVSLDAFFVESCTIGMSDWHPILPVSYKQRIAQGFDSLVSLPAMDD